MQERYDGLAFFQVVAIMTNLSTFFVLQKYKKNDYLNRFFKLLINYCITIF